MLRKFQQAYHLSPILFKYLEYKINQSICLPELHIEKGNGSGVKKDQWNPINNHKVLMKVWGAAPNGQKIDHREQVNIDCTNYRVISDHI